MKTLLLCPELFARESGIQRIMRLYLKALCETAGDGGEVRLVVLNDHEFPETLLRRYAGERLTLRRACHHHKPAFVWHALRAASGIDRVVCGHLGQLSVAWLARCLHRRIEYDLVAHGIEVWRPYSWTERLALRGARRILCVSDFTRREMQQRIDLPESRFAVVPNALDPYFAGTLTGASPKPAEPVILTVARLDAAEGYKGVDHLIEALPTVRQTLPAARLRIIGTGSDVPRLENLAAMKGVGAAVEFAGFVDDDRLSEAYRSCAVFALPSRGEGFGIVFLEAMAHGKPCLGARAGAVPEIIEATSGVLVDFGDVPQIARQLVWALQHSWNPEQIRRRAAGFGYPIFKEQLRRALAA
ncbi:MAG: glycosyltransferase family 4 protein [Opitutaceae bacterium]